MSSAAERFVPIQSRSDQRQHRGLIFRNRMKVMLVSDPTTDKSAASMDVNVGSMNDPEEVPGLAHFLEHMLFLGTEKFPDENEYSQFLSNHNGHCNAFTSGQNTNFYFDVSPEHLGGALDRFGQFFISPLFTEDATEREMKAVDSEFANSVQNDAWRRHVLEKSWSSPPNHDYAKFGCGNVQTLKTTPSEKGIDVRSQLLEFHKKWYSPNIMCLAVLGRESLDDLEAMVTDLFSGIEDKDVQIPEWSDGEGQKEEDGKGHPYPAGTGLQLMKVVPIKDVRHMHLVFSIPDLIHQWRTSPGSHFSHLIGHEGKGSLLSELKRREWCNSLGAGSGTRPANGFDFFRISVDLTLEGIQHVDEIVQLVFQYLNVLRKDGGASAQWIFEERAQLLQTLFDYKDKEKPCNYVVQLSGTMHSYPIQDVLRCNCTLDDFQPQLMTEFLDKWLTADNCRVVVTAQQFADECTQTEKWYGTKHLIQPVDPATAAKWSDRESVHENLHLPEPNPFIAKDFELCARDQGQEEVRHPTVIKDTALMRLWFKQDAEFLLPKACILVRIFSPLAYVNPEHANCNSLFQELFHDFMTEELYPAEMAHLYFSVSPNKYGLTLSLGGYHDKQKVLLTTLLNALADYKVDPKRFKIFKEIYRRRLKNYASEQPYRHASYNNSVLLTQRYWTKADLLASLDHIEAEDIQDYLRRLFRCVYVECLMCGNLTPQQALDYADTVETLLVERLGSTQCGLADSEKVKDRQFALQSNSNLFQSIENAVHDTTCIETYYQVGLQETKTTALLELYAKLINEPCMNTLRTKEQLGYIVWSGVRRECGVQGLYVLVQGSRDPAYLNDRIEIFLESMRTTIAEMPEETFESVRDALIAKLLEKPKKLTSRVNQYWTEITSQQYNFERDIVESEELKGVSKQQILEFYDEHISGKSATRKKVSCHVVPKDAASKLTLTDPSDLTHPTPTQISSQNSFKSRLPLYPLATPFKEPSAFTRKV